MTKPDNSSNWKPAKSWLVFILLTIVILWAAHVTAFFPHEYSHSFTAWVMGWKNNPLDLNYGHPTTANLLLQSDIDENVNYDPFFAGGHGIQAGMIALAGLFIGNLLITYPLSRWGYKRATQRNSRTTALFMYWLVVASVGNLIDYVPVRTFTASGDMHTLAKGFDCSPRVIATLLGVPFMVILGYFLISFAPKALHWLFPASPGRRAVMVVLSAFTLFGFYGAAGWSKTDPISHYSSVISVCVLLPVAVILGFWLTDRFWMKNPTATK